MNSYDSGLGPVEKYSSDPSNLIFHRMWRISWLADVLSAGFAELL